MKRRTFLQTASLSGMALPAAQASPGMSSAVSPAGHGKPMVLSTWDFGPAVTETTYGILQSGGSLVEAVEKGVQIPEADPTIHSVGRGGFPDRDGRVTLDACIMDGNGRCGSVVFLEHILHPISVARMVMEKTPHVMLAGEGALQFALANGFRKENLLTEAAEKRYREWKKKGGMTPRPINRDNHDTIGLLAMDGRGGMAGACTTSGAAFKMHGRVGDSPIIGAGLYVDNDIGAATATGLGELVMKVAGSFLIVELMRQGKSPEEACRLAIERILHKQASAKDIEPKEFLVAFLALRKDGEFGAMSYRKGFQYSLNTDGKNRVFEAKSVE